MQVRGFASTYVITFFQEEEAEDTEAEEKKEEEGEEGKN